ncbi:Arc domain protein DNA binding protein domain protein [Rubellimicrobium mesophilum DSM 19309]|uniref:Arc domain protein DNA binding protein domain protein n=1 Tax=Rubellimicrobium mesophilum DSM 19309 TaxID=442562 RepID=A0A017HQW8_9RHOB|nr:Arc family DNA-binding protein [Rubellimicrobium mesophilum]EYD76781.1 Arc domain protein DNA binding protein domain protein [Rubellimicrobium mesophilum DSM 19309]
MSDDSQAPRIAPFGLRMPPDLKDRVARAAEANSRSMNAEIVAALLEKYPPPPEHGFWFVLMTDELGIDPNHVTVADLERIKAWLERELKTVPIYANPATSEPEKD